MKKLKKMTIESHIRGSEGSHRVKKEDAKANGIWRQMTNEEYEREKAEIVIHLEVMMEMLQKEKEYQICGFLMRRKIRWHRPHKMKEPLMNAQGEDEVLKTSEKNEGDRQNSNFVLKGDGIAGSHSNAHAQLRESTYFQYAAKFENKEGLAYDDSQE